MKVKRSDGSSGILTCDNTMQFVDKAMNILEWQSLIRIKHTLYHLFNLFKRSLVNHDTDERIQITTTKF